MSISNQCYGPASIFCFLGPCRSENTEEKKSETEQAVWSCKRFCFLGPCRSEKTEEEKSKTEQVVWSCKRFWVS